MRTGDDAPGSACAAGTADTRFANFAFASELGSGIYSIGATTVQVYQLPFSRPLRLPSEHSSRPGIRLILPVTVGFFNFQTRDLVHLEVPTAIGAMSLEPGVELDYYLTENWSAW